MPAVLVVDDDDCIRHMVCGVLDDDGFACQQAANGKAALRLLHASTDQLVVVLDLMMPGMSGKDVLDAVEADRSLVGRHAFILLTAEDKTLPLAVLQTLKRLDVPVISKPFDLDHLVTAVRRVGDRLIGDHDTYAKFSA